MLSQSVLAISFLLWGLLSRSLVVPATMSATEESSLWTEVRPSNRHESVSEVRERVIQEGLKIFDRAEFIIGRKIGEGGQGAIFEVSFQSNFYSNPRLLVVKKFRPLKGISQGHFPPQILTHTWHHICRPCGVFFDIDDSLCIVMQRFSTDLRTLIDSRHDGECAPFPEDIALIIITRLALGLKVLHEHGIYHRDIKAANILVQKIPEVLIADFENSDNVVGTGFWRAPEILQTLDQFPKDRAPLSDKQLQAADVYSFGMTCYEILTGKSPFDGHRWSDYNLVLSGGRPELPDHVPEPLKNLIRTCWHQNPDSRPSFIVIVIHLKQFDSVAFEIEAWQDAMKSQGEADAKWQDASPEECLVELKQALITPEELRTGGLNILPATAKLQRMIAEFISYCEEFVSKFGWDSYDRHPSLPFVESVERRRLVMLMQHQLQRTNGGILAFADELRNHLDRVVESGRIVKPSDPDFQTSLFSQLWRLMFFFRLLTTRSKLHDAAESKLSISEFTHVDKFATVKAFINNLLDAGVSRTTTASAVAGIYDQLNELKCASYGEEIKFLVKWYSMTILHPYYDIVAEFLDAVLCSRVFYETILLYLGYKMSAVLGLSDLLFGYTRYSVSGFHEVLLKYLELRVDYASSPFFRCYIFWKFFGWKGLLCVLICIIFLVRANKGASRADRNRNQ
ncbi:hypothetical protein KC19_5G168000 [Ceratodon purpureus]|uniref:Protein kinase domain-containing protein n=1 Tax=Ceratodon purpureus TaxID=3225 RepID=A0A8T0I3V4_CERPU|nr:hypothetical protein KC19_5G168000 [Ceratodon purpureus]